VKRRNGFQPCTLLMIEQAMLPGVFVTAREVEKRLPIDLSRNTIRAAMRRFVSEGRARAKGDVLQRRYCFTGDQTA
jgi:hypothetical protein